MVKWAFWSGGFSWRRGRCCGIASGGTCWSRTCCCCTGCCWSCTAGWAAGGFRASKSAPAGTTWCRRNAAVFYRVQPASPSGRPLSCPPIAFVFTGACPSDALEFFALYEQPCVVVYRYNIRHLLFGQVVAQRKPHKFEVSDALLRSKLRGGSWFVAWPLCFWSSFGGPSSPACRT